MRLFKVEGRETIYDGIEAEDEQEALRLFSLKYPASRGHPVKINGKIVSPGTPVKIYIVKCSGDDEDHVVWVGINEEEAFQTVKELNAERNYISIWENGKEISEYYRNCWYDNPEMKVVYDPKLNRYDKWQRNSGAIIPRLETT